QEDLARCALAVNGQGEVIVSYSAHRKGRFDLFARKLTPGARQPGPEIRLTGTNDRDPGRAYLSPVMATGQSGEVHLACQGWGETATAGVYYLSGLALQETGYSARFAGQAGIGSTSWNVAIAIGPSGEWQTASDGFVQGDYDIDLTVRGTL